MITSNEAEKLWQLVKPLKVAMLVTQDNRLLQARPMHLVQSSFEGSFYFFTNVHSEKVFEINKTNDVCLAFSCPKTEIYVSVSAEAKLNQDRKLIDALWNPFVEAWFPEGKDSSNVGIIAINAIRAEYWQGKNNQLVELFNYAKAYLTGNKPDLGEHGELA